jgi:hypothetical protein
VSLSNGMLSVSTLKQMQRLTDMIRPDQIPDEVVEAAAVQISNGRTVAQAIAAALNAWTGMAVFPGMQHGRRETPPHIILPLTKGDGQ